MKAAGVDPAGAANRDRDPRRRPHHHRIELLALLGAAHLRVVQIRERAPVAAAQGAVVDQHRCGDQRPCQRAAPRLVGAGDEARSERAVEAEQPLPPGGAGRGARARAAA